MTAPIVVWGEVLWDRFPDGARLGGAPANVAWHLAMMGARPKLASRVGDDDAGREARARLAARGVDVALVGVDPERATGEVEVTVVGGEPRYRLVPGRAWERIALDDAVRAALAGAAAVVYGTLAQRTDDGLAAWRELIAATPPGCLRVCDPNLRPGALDVRALDAALAAADVVKLNDAERRALADRAGHDPVAALLARGARLVAVTHGARGATLHAPGAELAIAGTPAAPGGDNVGCGDAFVAALVLGLTRGWPLPRTGALASRWAAAVAGRRGATPDFPAAAISAMLGAP